MPPRSLGKSSDSLAQEVRGGVGCGRLVRVSGVLWARKQGLSSLTASYQPPGPPAHPWWTLVIKILDMFTVWLFHYTSKFYPK